MSIVRFTPSVTISETFAVEMCMILAMTINNIGSRLNINMYTLKAHIRLDGIGDVSPISLQFTIYSQSICA